MKNILIIGGYGFIGSNLLFFISQKSILDYNFIILDRKINNLFNINESNVIKNYIGDFSDSILLRKIFEENKIDLVFHFLSTSVPSTSKDILYDINSNLSPTINLLNLISEFNIEKIVFLSSAGAIYSNSDVLYHQEDENSNPKSSYGIIKLTIEKYIQYFSITYGIKFLILRLSNVYGPFHISNHQGIINIALKNSYTKDIINIWGNGDTKKDYIYVEDVVSIIISLISNEISNEIINIGSGQNVSVNEILFMIENISNKLFLKYEKKKHFDNESFALSLKKLYKFIPNYNFLKINDGIEKTNKWFLKSIKNQF